MEIQHTLVATMKGRAIYIRYTTCLSIALRWSIYTVRLYSRLTASFLSATLSLLQCRIEASNTGVTFRGFLRVLRIVARRELPERHSIRHSSPYAGIISTRAEEQ